jgi:glutaredoxin
MINVHVPPRLLGGLIVGVLAWAAGTGAALAQYKVVGPDGSVTYTDRPPADARLAVTPMGRTPGAAAAATTASNLPAEMRQVSQRYPVTLYTSAECPACDTGRQWLAQRGVPYRERLIATEQDAQALNDLVGGRTVPALTIGAQPVRGFSETDWAAYLDAAGYPRDNKLPKTWRPPTPTTLVEPPPRPAVVAEPRTAPRQAAPPPAPAPVPPAASGPGGVRF